jgi:hypothetical protein
LNKLVVGENTNNGKKPSRFGKAFLFSLQFSFGGCEGFFAHNGAKAQRYSVYVFSRRRCGAAMGFVADVGVSTKGQKCPT